MRTHSQHSHQTNIINIVMRTSPTLTTRVAIGDRGIESIGNLLTQTEAGKKVLLLTQPTVNERWAQPVLQRLQNQGFEAVLLELADGEKCKSHDVLLHVWQKLQDLQFTRADSIVAVGGGSLTDLAGFAASTYLRGVKLFLVPTSLLAQVDAAIGGKTGINLPSGKNLAGSFYFPAGVIADSQVLSSLPEREVKSGLGEIIKYAFMESTIIAETDYRGGPRSFFSLLEDLLGKHGLSFETADLDGVIAASIKMKLAVVSKDPFEGRLRRCLNLGHTLAHAIEKVSNYAVSHGEAVGIGLVFACKVAIRRQRFEQSDLDRLLRVMEKTGLPTAVPADLSIPDIVKAMTFDKKKVGDNIKFVLPVKPLGVVDLDSNLSLDELKECLSE